MVIVASSCRRAASSLSTKNGKGEGVRTERVRKQDTSPQQRLRSAGGASSELALRQTALSPAQQADPWQAQTNAASPGRSTAPRRYGRATRQQRGNGFQARPTRAARRSSPCRRAPTPSARAAGSAARLQELGGGRAEGPTPRSAGSSEAAGEDRYHVRICSSGTRCFCFSSRSTGLKRHRDPNQPDPGT